MFNTKMGKRILLILISFIIFTGAAFAYSTPRWPKMPLCVYIPKQSEGATITNAFKAWQTGSKGTLRFLYRDSANFASISDIVVEFSDEMPDNKPYKLIIRYAASWDTSLEDSPRYYARVGIVIALNDENGEKISSSKLYAAALRAIGESLGIKPGNAENSVMYVNSDLTQTQLTSEDIAELMNVYKPDKK